MQRRVTTFGLMTVICGALTTACGNDTDSRRDILGQGGTDGSGAAGNMGGSSGSTTGQGGSSGGGGLTPLCSGGCVELNVPIPAGAADAAAVPPIYRQAQFVFRPGMDQDFSTTVVTWRIKALISTSGIPPEEMYVAAFAQNGSTLNYSGLYGAQIPLTPANGFTNDETWVNLIMDVPNAGIGTGGAETPDAGVVAADAGDAGGVDAGDAGSGGPTGPVATPSTLDPTQVFQWGLYVGSTGATAGTVRVAIDSVDYEGSTLMDVSFFADVEGFQIDNYQTPPGTALVHRP